MILLYFQKNLKHKSTETSGSKAKPKSSEDNVSPRRLASSAQRKGTATKSAAGPDVPGLKLTPAEGSRPRHMTSSSVSSFHDRKPSTRKLVDPTKTYLQCFNSS